LVLWLSDEDVGEVPGDLETPTWSVSTKIDLEAVPTTIRVRKDADFRLSALTGEGVSDLLEAIVEWASHGRSGPGHSVFTRERHRVAVVEAADAVRAALDRHEPDIAAEELRLAGKALGRLSGRFDPDDVLDIVFQEFCIGK
jgi:tRNA modification GTPase